MERQRVASHEVILIVLLTNIVVTLPQYSACYLFFRVEMENQVCTWSSIFSYDPSPVDTTEVLISIDQKLRLVLGVSSVYLCQFVADVAFRRCSIRYWTVLFEMQPHIESG